MANRKVSLAALRDGANTLSIYKVNGECTHQHLIDQIRAAAEVLEELRNEPWDDDEDYHYAQERVAEKFVALQGRTSP
jgi:hypothetical protein